MVCAEAQRDGLSPAAMVPDPAVPYLAARSCSAAPGGPFPAGVLPMAFSHLVASTSLDLPTPDVRIPQNLSTLLTGIRRHLHMNPEIGFQEYETSRFIREILEMHGLRVHGPLAGTGLYVDIEGAHPGRHIGYRADIDALPTPDAKTVPYASRREGAAHLCGHDAHTAVAIGVALLLDAQRDALHGTVRVFFQPNEEGIPSGAPAMIEAGVLDGLDAVYAIHVDSSLESGRFGLLAGPITSAASQFTTTVRGPGSGHSARPHETTDTVWVATQIATAFYQLAGRISDARDNTVITICRFRGGEAFNVIPAEVEFGGTLRCTRNEDRPFFFRRMQEIARQTAALYGGTAEVVFSEGAPAVVNDPLLVQRAAEVIQDTLGPEAVYWIPRPSMGTEDFAHYLTHVPGLLIRVGTAAGPETSYPLHDSLFDLDEAALAPAAQVLSRILMNHLAQAADAP
ncbi:N-acyl-L-amino acid amidohydrolase [Rhodothermaceae bacterium RA]|nr:N-acyl-L-amino acid amidohydrolase [Rhodothermaceae bacterium RA]